MIGSRLERAQFNEVWKIHKMPFSIRDGKGPVVHADWFLHFEIFEKIDFFEKNDFFEIFEKFDDDCDDDDDDDNYNSL